MQFPVSTESNPKGFWERPEGVTGMITIAGALVGAYFAVPYLLTLAAGLFSLLGYTLGIVVLGAILAGLIVVLSDRKFRVLLSLGFKMVMRKLTNVIVTIDPIGVMEIYIERMKEKRKKIGEARTELRGQIRKIEKVLMDSKTEYENSMNMAKVAQDRGNAAQMQLHSRKSMRLESLARETLIPLRDQLVQHADVADKIYEATELIIEDMKDDLRVRAIRRESMEASFSLIQSANEILHGGTEERVLYDAALEADLNDYSAKLGALDSFLEDSRPVIEGFDLQNGVYQQQALERLSKWSNEPAFDFGTNVLSQRRQQAVAIEVPAKKIAFK